MTSPKVSKFRWTTGSAAKATDELAIQGTPAIWDCGNLIAANEQYVAFPSSSAGSVSLLSHDKISVRGFAPKKLFGQKGHVIDLAFSPFAQDILTTGSEDGTIRVWKIPEGGITADTEDAIASLNGHSRKVGILAFHSAAENVLASAGMDNVVNVWDLTQAAPKFSFNQPCGDNQIMSLNWNLDGSLLNITGKDKNVHILDSRSGAVVGTGKAHEGSKTMRSLWAKRRNQIITFGFNKSQYRQMMLFDARNLAKPLFVKEVDQMSNIMLPFFDEDTSMLYVGGRGEAGIKYFEVWDEAQAIQPLQAFSHGDPQKGLAMVPKAAMDVKDCQLNKFFKLTNNKLTTISFNLPRRQAGTQFQSDIFPDTFAGIPSISASDFFAGKNAVPKEVSLAAKFDGGDVEVVATSGKLSESSPSSPNTAQSTSPNNKTPAATPTTTVAPVPTKSALETAADNLEAQKKKVAAAQKTLDDETAVLVTLQKKFDEENQKVAAAVAAEKKEEEEKTAAVEEEKKEEQQQQQQETAAAVKEEKKQDDDL